MNASPGTSGPCAARQRLLFGGCRAAHASAQVRRETIERRGISFAHGGKAPACDAVNRSGAGLEDVLPRAVIARAGGEDLDLPDIRHALGQFQRQPFGAAVDVLGAANGDEGYAGTLLHDSKLRAIALGTYRSRTRRCAATIAARSL